jgi:hypothetical protein
MLSKEYISALNTFGKSFQRNTDRQLEPKRTDLKGPGLAPAEAQPKGRPTFSCLEATDQPNVRERVRLSPENALEVMDVVDLSKPEARNTVWSGYRRPLSAGRFPKEIPYPYP